MRTRITVLALLIAIIFSCSIAQGATDDIIAGMSKKLSRGFVNIFTGWLELPMQTIKGYKRGCPNDEDNKFLGTTYGFFKGIGHTIGRTAWGFVEFFGFWTANPEDNIGIGIPLDSNFAWEEGEGYNCLDPSFTEATLNPMGQKLTRGLGNGFFGFLELPGQITKGIKNGANDFGIVKGVWFSLSRELYGIADVATVIFPQPEDNPGYPFEEEYPWDSLLDTIEE